MRTKLLTGMEKKMSWARKVATVCCTGLLAFTIDAATASAIPQPLPPAAPPPQEFSPPPSGDQVVPDDGSIHVAHPIGQKAGLNELGSCVASKGKLDVLLMIDETESLIHQVKDGNIDPNTPGSDAPHNRVPAAQSFVNQLLARQNDENLDVRIRVAGFGQEYKNGITDAAYGDWVQLDNQTVKGVKNTIAGFSERTAEQYTNYANAFEGAYQDFSRSGSEDGCKMIVTFTDGALTAQEGQEVAQDALCRPDGITDKFRAAGITNVGIGLSDPKNPSDFNLFEGITEGTGMQCGSLDPNGVFFPADSVGSLFASFHQALGSGGAFSQETAADQPFEFVLDDSIDSVRFSVVAKDDLGPNAKLNLVAPDGSKLALEGENTETVGGAEVTWQASHEPVQQADGEMKIKSPSEWAGAWTLQFEGFSEDRADHKVFNSVKIQPDLQIEFAGAAGVAEGNLTARSNEEVTVRLVGRDGQARKLKGAANLDLEFIPSGEGTPVQLLSNEDVSQGKTANVSLEKIKDLPASGKLKATAQVVTAGPGGKPGTALDPVVSELSAAISKQDMPVLPGSMSFTMMEREITASIPVTGPGKVWIPSETKLDAAALPEGVDAIKLSSDHSDVNSALTLAEGEEATLPIKISVSELKDGVVNGTIPVSIARADGSEEAIVPVAASGSLTIPLNKTTFTLAFLAALLAGLLIPLGILYLVRFANARVPREYFGAQRIPLHIDGLSVQYAGNSKPVIDLDEVSRNQVIHDGRALSVLGHRLQVRSFQLNPLAEPKVIVETVPSIGPNGGQISDQAVLPLVVQGSWFVAAMNGAPELIVMPRLPLDRESAARLENEIAEKLPNFAEKIQRVLDLQQPQQPQQFPSANTWGGPPSPSGGQSSNTDWSEPPKWN
ncbi:MAG: vWA domain-containing protein [Corynebacterium sp.]|nr:vWA domain-containing protein [Corynebacterium sp.]